MTFNPLVGLVSWGDFSVSGPNVAGGLWHWGGVSYYGVFDGGITTLQLSMGNLAVMRPLSIVWSIREASATTLVLDNGNGLEDTHLVFHHIAVITFLTYAMGAVPMSIWYNRKWSTTFKTVVDALLYALATGWIFSMMWPKT